MKLYRYTHDTFRTAEDYDTGVLVACLQGLYNRNLGPYVYLVSTANVTPGHWLDIFSQPGRWLADREIVDITLDDLIEMARPFVKKVIFWDTNVPATVNVACTAAGVEDGVVFSSELWEKYGSRFSGLDVLDLRGKFDGHISGSAKNDAYRWAISEYLEKGLCSKHFICFYEDSYLVRDLSKSQYDVPDYWVSYHKVCTSTHCAERTVIMRDWAIYNRAFVFDLSPWGDCAPEDELTQPIGTDVATMHAMLAEEMKQADGVPFEMVGMLSFVKYCCIAKDAHNNHNPVAGEWETIYILSGYNSYQNSIATDCYNQSFHSQHKIQAQKQPRPAPRKLENKVYICPQMCDYDNATSFYDFMIKNWEGEKRGTLPLCWGIDPNMEETYPDVLEYWYETRSDNDFFAADASAAGYFNPSQIKPENWPKMVAHNKHFMERFDITIAPMVFDWGRLTDLTKDNFQKFAPDGIGANVTNWHDTETMYPTRHLWKGMPVDVLTNQCCDWSGTGDAAAQKMEGLLAQARPDQPAFHFMRLVWYTVDQVLDTLDCMKKRHPDLAFEVVDPYTYFDLLKQYLEKNGPVFN